MYLAFFGTGPCDPSKKLKEFLAFVVTVAGWLIIILLLRKINGSKPTAKIGLSMLLIISGVIGTALIFLVTWLGLACSGYR